MRNKILIFITASILFGVALFQLSGNADIGMSGISTPPVGIGSTSITTLGTVTTGTWEGTKIGIGYGGTNATNATDARTNLGLGTIATQNADNATITGGSLSGTTIAPKIITKSGSGSLSAAECTGTIIHLYGQTLDTTLELPAAFANGNFVFVVDATVEKYVRLDPTGSEVQSLDGTDLTAGYYVGLTTAVKGAVIQYIAIRTGASTYQWAAFTVTSAWTPQS